MVKTVYFSTTNVPLNYGVIEVVFGNNLNATVNGVAVDANNNPIPNTVVTAKIAGGNATPIKLNTNANGEFTYIVPICTPTLNISLVAYNGSTFLNSGIQNYTVQAGVQNIGSIQADVKKSEYMHVANHNNGVIQHYYLVEPNANFSVNYNNFQQKLNVTCFSNLVGVDWYTRFKIDGLPNINTNHVFSNYYDKMNAVIFNSNTYPIMPNLPVYFSEYATVKDEFISCRSTLTFQNINNVSRVIDFRIKRDNN